MPHGGYHGTVVMGGNIVQQGYQKPDGSYGIKGGIGDAALNIPVNQQAQTAAEATAAAQAKKKEMEENFRIQTASAMGKPNPIIIEGPAGMTTTGTIADVPGFDADDAKAAQMEFQTQNQILNNLLIAEQQAKNREGIIRAAQQGVLNKSDLTGFEGGFLGLNAFATPSTGISGIKTVFNPFTKEPLGGTTGVAGENLATQIKAREGLSTPQYNTFISDLYTANPELYQETFPLESGQALKPFFVRIGEGIMGLPGASQIGQLASNVISPLSGLITDQSTATPKIQYDNMGNAIGIIPETSGGSSGDPQAVPEGMDMSIYGSFIGKPGPFIGNVIDQDQDGVDDRFQSGPGEAKAPPYSPPKQLANIFPSIGLPALVSNYASMAPQFTGSEYTNQGVSPAFLKNLRRFYG